MKKKTTDSKRSTHKKSTASFKEHSGWWGDGPVFVFLYSKKKKEAITNGTAKEILQFVEDSEHVLHESEALRIIRIDNEYSHPVLFVDTGKEAGLDFLDHLRMAAYRLSKWAENNSVKTLMIPPLIDDSEKKRNAILQGLCHASYAFDKYKSKKHKKADIEYLFTDDMEIDGRSLQAMFSGIDLAKNLINEPGNSLTPAIMVNIAQGIAQKHGLAIKVRRSKELEKEGYNGILTVGRGSQNEPAMVTLSYRPKYKNPSHLALVGKGITFDTGGICLKPQDKMYEMKSDMSGAAIVLAAVQVVAELKLPIEVDAILCLAENRPGENAMLPGDIFKAKNGKTVMVENTDAEGRLVLIDGLMEAATLGVTHVIDIATLTGAIQRALGTSIGGLFSNSEGLALTIVEAGAENGEKWWRMPLDEEYAEDLKDKVADIRNIADGGPGAISAAMFLKEFVDKNMEWAHLDIAGVAFSAKGYKYTEHGATAFGLKTIVETVQRYSVDETRVRG
ncbi:MAG: leucyl aminopeptidase family protein [Candidatus Fibromonas sp.]|jgi:leucyl aminopeptidase|nr:leucyl aminopeptidase family protein [Candidatus Fibromonas sp.]